MIAIYNKSEEKLIRFTPDEPSKVDDNCVTLEVVFIKKPTLIPQGKICLPAFVPEIENEKYIRGWEFADDPDVINDEIWPEL